MKLKGERERRNGKSVGLEDGEDMFLTCNDELMCFNWFSLKTMLAPVLGIRAEQRERADDKDRLN